jgi:hypothetical protein
VTALANATALEESGQPSAELGTLEALDQRPILFRIPELARLHPIPVTTSRGHFYFRRASPLVELGQT